MDKKEIAEKIRETHDYYFPLRKDYCDCGSCRRAYYVKIANWISENFVEKSEVERSYQIKCLTPFGEKLGEIFGVMNSDEILAEIKRLQEDNIRLKEIEKKWNNIVEFKDTDADYLPEPSKADDEDKETRKKVIEKQREVEMSKADNLLEKFATLLFHNKAETKSECFNLAGAIVGIIKGQYDGEITPEPSKECDMKDSCVYANKDKPKVQLPNVPQKFSDHIDIGKPYPIVIIMGICNELIDCYSAVKDVLEGRKL